MNAPLKPLLLAVLLAAPASAIQVEKLRVARAAALGGGTSEVEAVAGEALVRFDAGVSTTAKAAVLRNIGAEFIEDLPSTKWSRVSLPPGMSVAGGVGFLNSLEGVREVDIHHVYRPSLVPNDAAFPQQWHLSKINAPAAWEYETGSSSRVTIAVLDAGLDSTHPDFSGKFTNTTNWFCDPGTCDNAGCTSRSGGAACVQEAGGTAIAACNHGTRVAGVASAATNNGSGVAGVAWGAQLTSFRLFRTADCPTNCASDSCGTTDAAIVFALQKAISLNNTQAYGRIIVNMSLGEKNVFACPGSIQDAVNAAVATSTGMVIVVAAGNEGTDVTAPANCAGVIPVGATDSNDNVASFSNRGTALSNNGLVAPGVSLTTLDINGGITGSATGTSFAAPVIAGLSALIWARQPTYSPTKVRDTMRSSTDGIGVSAAAVSAQPAGNTAGAGRVNAFKAVKLAVDGTLAGFAGDQKLIAFPNPFRTSDGSQATIILPPGLQSRGTSVRVYTIDGQLVRDLKGQTTWDGRNDHGAEVASGVYIVLVKTDAGTQKTKLAVIR